MRLLTVSHFYESHGGGIERVAAHLCRQFALQGHESLWAASDADPPPSVPVKGVPLSCADPMEARTGLPMPIPGPRAIRDLARAIADSDAVIVHDALYLTSILATSIARLRGKPVVLIQHIAGIEFANPFLRALMWIANQLVTRPMLYAASVRVFISNEVRRKLLGARAHRNSMILFNGVDASIFHPDRDLNRYALRREHGLSSDAVCAIFVGRFVAKKGMSVLEALARHRPNLSLLFAGSGPMRPERWDLPNVHVLGPQSQHSLAKLYAAADLLLLPSIGEGYPLVIQEAMACGLPVICGEDSALADPGAAKWLRGVKVDLREPEQSAQRCAAAIDSLLRDPIDKLEMASYAAKTYNWSRMARAITQSVSTSIEVIHGAACRFQPR